MVKFKYRLVYEYEGKTTPVAQFSDRTFSHPQHAWKALEEYKQADRRALRLLGYRVRRIVDVSERGVLDAADAIIRNAPISGSKASLIRRALSWIRPTLKD